MSAFQQRKGPWARYAPQIDVLGQITELSEEQILRKAVMADRQGRHDDEVEKNGYYQSPKEALDPAEQVRGERSRPRRWRKKDSPRTERERLDVTFEAGTWQAEEPTVIGQGAQVGWRPGYAQGGRIVQPVDMVPGSPGRLIDQASYYDTGEPAETITPDRITYPQDIVYVGDVSSAPGSPVKAYVDAGNAAYPDQSGTAFPGLPIGSAYEGGVRTIPGLHLPAPAQGYFPPGLQLPPPPGIQPVLPGSSPPNNGYMPPPPPVDRTPGGGVVELVPVTPAPTKKGWIVAAVVGATVLTVLAYRKWG